MKDAYGVDPLGITAENVADEYQVSRGDQDAMALRSQHRSARAQAEGRFAEDPADRQKRKKDNGGYSR